MRERAVVSVASAALRGGFGTYSGYDEPLSPQGLVFPAVSREPEIGRCQSSVRQALAVRASGIGEQGEMSRKEFTPAVRMPARHGERERTQIAAETHLQQGVFEYLMAFLRDGQRSAAKHPHRVDRSVETADRIGGICPAVVEDGTVGLEAGTGPVNIAESVVDPPGDGPEIGIFIRGWLQNQNGCHPAHQRGVEGVDVHTRFRRGGFHFSHSREPFHSRLHLVEQPGLPQHILHKHRSGVEIPHTVAEVMQGALGAFRREALVEQMPRHHHIHPPEFGLVRPLVQRAVCGGQVQKIVIVVAEQLPVFPERGGSVPDAEIDVGLSVSREENRFAAYRAVSVQPYAIAVVHPPQRVRRNGFPGGHKAYETLLHKSHILFLRGGEGSLRNVEAEIPAPVEHEPVDVGACIYERRLPVCGVVAGILKG